MSSFSVWDSTRLGLDRNRLVLAAVVEWLVGSLREEV